MSMHRMMLILAVACLATVARAQTPPNLSGTCSVAGEKVSSVVVFACPSGWARDTLEINHDSDSDEVVWYQVNYRKPDSPGTNVNVRWIKANRAFSFPSNPGLLVIFSNAYEFIRDLRDKYDWFRGTMTAISPLKTPSGEWRAFSFDVNFYVWKPYDQPESIRFGPRYFGNLYPAEAIQSDGTFR